MRKMKWLSLLLALAMVFSVACADEGASVPEDQQPLIERTQEDDKVQPTFEGSVQEAAIELMVSKPDHSYLIATEDVIAAMEANEEVFLLDIRSAEDYGKGHLKGAVNIPWGSDFAKDIAKLPGDQPIYLYCYSGQTAGQTVGLLNILGYDARSIKYGYNFGISKVEGIESHLEETVNAFPQVAPLAYDPAIFEAVDAYYQGLATTENKNYKISEEAAKEVLDQNKEGYFFLDIRKADDYAAGHIPTAFNAPYGPGFVDFLGDIPQDKTVVVNCYSGQTAGQIVAMMRLLDYDAISLNGGMGTGGNAPLGWNNKGFETTNVVADKAQAFFINKPDHSYLITTEDVVKEMEAAGSYVLLDIRSAADYEKSHLQGAVNIPWGPNFGHELEKIDADKPVYLYCYSGQTAGQTVAMLNVMGYDARSIKYGFNFGISKVEGIDAYLETTVNDFGKGEKLTLSPAMKSALVSYYEGLAEVADTSYKNYKISEDDLKGMLDGGEALVVLDIRKADDYLAGHIPTAINMPYGPSIIDTFGTLPMDQKIAVTCYSGQTAGQTVAILRLMGYDAVSLNGGMGTPGNAPLGWTNKGFETIQ